jgi:hypothetical protein
VGATPAHSAGSALYVVASAPWAIAKGWLTDRAHRRGKARNEGVRLGLAAALLFSAAATADPLSAADVYVVDGTRLGVLPADLSA